MSDYINKIKKGETEYDIQDARVPEIDAGAEGKVLKVDSGAAVWGDAGGEDSYFHTYEVDLTQISGDATLQDLLNALSISVNDYFEGFVNVKYMRPIGPQYIEASTGVVKFRYFNQGMVEYIKDNNLINGKFILGKVMYNMQKTIHETIGYGSEGNSRDLLPSTNNLDISKTYQLQTAGQGAPEWAEASSGGVEYEEIFVSNPYDDITYGNFISLCGFDLTDTTIRTESKYIILSNDMGSDLFSGYAYVELDVHNFGVPLYRFTFVKYTKTGEIITNYTDYSIIPEFEPSSEILNTVIAAVVRYPSIYLPQLITSPHSNAVNWPTGSLGTFVYLLGSCQGVYNYFKIPVLPTDASSKTYILKCVNGTLTWVEE